MKEKTLEELQNLKARVWLYLRNEDVWQLFVQKAKNEGFKWADGRNISIVGKDNIVALNNNKTFNYVGYIGHIWLNNTNDDILKIDFEKYIKGDENYFYKKS